MQVTIYPSLDLRARPPYPSRERMGGGDLFLIGDDIEWMLDHYFTDARRGERLARLADPRRLVRGICRRPWS